MAAPIVATGLTMTFTTSAWTANYVSISRSGNSRESLDTSHQGTTTTKSFVPASLRDPGSWDLEFQYDPLQDPPQDAAAETVTLAWPDGEEEACTAFMTNFEYTGSLDEVAMGTATLKITGSVTSPTPTAT